MKKIIISVYSMLVLLNCNFIYSAPNELFLKLPVRVISNAGPGEGTVYLKDLNKDDFELQVNSETISLVAFFKKEKSIEAISAGRQFVLAFDAVDYGKPLVETVSYFVHRILTPSDQLLLRSPLQTHRINTGSEKEEIIQYIENLLVKDIGQWKEKKSASLEIMHRLIENLERKIDAKKAGIRSVLFFINHYTNEWRKYDKDYLLANLEQYPDITSLLAQREGEKWLINFQERDLIPMLARYQQISKKLKKYVSSFPKGFEENATLIRSSLDKIEKSMLFSGDFPMEGMLNALLGANINYNVVFFSGQAGDTQTLDSVSPGYESILTDISRKTGGMSIISSSANLVKNLETIAKNVDFYYELAFAVGLKPEDKRIEIKVTPPNTDVFYKTGFKKDELKWLMDWVTGEISISDFALQGRQVSVTMSGYKMNRLKNAGGAAEPNGIIKVEIRLIDEKNTTVYETGNTLKANDRSFNISLKLPSTFSGYFKLSITAIDLVANKSCQLNKYVKI